MFIKRERSVFPSGAIEKNDAFELLKLLMNPYPVSETIQVPIDIYISKKGIYADLGSVDLSQVKGYEECKAIIEKR